MAATPHADAFFLPRPDGQRFCLHHRPAGEPARAAVVQVHAFAEEMNKSRRMAMLQSRALARAGCAVLQIDLLGCGDSSGDFEDANWPAWRADVVAAAEWLRDRHPDAPLWFWGLRSGCLLAAEAAACIETPARFVFWQPITSGLIALRQFLRLRMAAMLGSGGNAVQEARRQLACGDAVEIAGYRLSAELATGLERSQLAPPPGTAQLVWFELSSRAGAELPPPSLATLAAWGESGGTVQSQVVEGPAFWQTTEIETVPALIEATTAAVLATEVGSPPSSPRRLDGESRPAEHAAPSMIRLTRLTQITRPDSPPSLVSEQALRFDCAGESLPGVLTLPGAPRSLGVLVIVGGPQYRAGSHRQFVLLARALAKAGYPVLRFDHRGIGDGDGESRSFEALDDDIGAALGAFGRSVPALRRFVIWGLCDGASAGLLHAGQRRDARLAGLCLVNPWTRSAETLARTQVKHYYASRVLEPAFWRKLFTGGIGFGAWRDFLASVRLARRSHRAGRLRADAVDDGPYTDRMARAWQRFPGRVLLLLSGNDYTAKEFLEFVAHDPAWRGALSMPAVERIDFAAADHTFSASADGRALEAATLAWLRRLDAESPARTASRAASEALR